MRRSKTPHPEPSPPAVAEALAGRQSGEERI